MTGYGLPRIPPTEEEIIRNSRLRQLYNHEFEQGRFFQVVFEDENGVTFQLATRTYMRVVYIKDKDDIEGIKLIKLIDGKEKGILGTPGEILVGRPLDLKSLGGNS